MAIYHLALQVIRRSDGRSAVAAAAYRTGKRLYDLRDGTHHDYARKSVAEAFTLAPAGANWALDSERLWNAVEVSERRRKSTLAREWEVALPAELSPSARSELVRRFAQDLVERYRVAVDVGIHPPDTNSDSRNWHAHVMMTTREVTPEGMGKKTRVLDDIASGPKEVEAVRALWAQRANEALQTSGFAQVLDHRSYRRQGLDKVPTEHLGPIAAGLERKAFGEQGLELERGVGISVAVAKEGFRPVTDRGQLIAGSALAARVREWIRTNQRVLEKLLERARKWEKDQGLGR